MPEGCKFSGPGRIKKYALLILVFFLMGRLSFAQEMTPSRIREVILFSNQALVKREGTTKVSKGRSELFVELEAFRVDSNSVSAKVFGEGEILSVQAKEVYLKELPQENIRVLVEKIKELKRLKTKRMDEKEVLEKKGLFLSSVVNFSQTQVPQDMKTAFPKVEDLEKTLTFLASNFQGINEKKQFLDSEIEKIDREISVLEKELDSLRRPADKGKKVVEILFDSKKEQEVKIEVNYLVENAYWKPSYKVTVPLTLQEADLIMFADIQQKTGEDWKNIALSVSNVIPLKGVGLPAPVSWLLDIPRPVRKGVREGELSLRQDLQPTSPVEAEKVPGAEAGIAYAQKRELPFSFEYQIPRTLDIESKDKQTILPLFSKRLAGEFFHYTVPRVSPLTFLVSKASADKELLSGQLNIYFGGRFIGRTFLGEKRAGEEFYLNLGADREVKVERVKTRDKVKETFFGTIQRNKIIRELAFKITLENLKDRSIRIKVLDSIPVSSTDKVEVKDIKITPEPIERNYQDKQGVLLWEFELGPGQKREIRMEFAIGYPKDMPLVGL